MRKLRSTIKRWAAQTETSPNIAELHKAVMRLLVWELITEDEAKSLFDDIEENPNRAREFMEKEGK